MELIIQIRTTGDTALVKTYGPAADGKLPHEADTVAIPAGYLPQHLREIADQLETS